MVAEDHLLFLTDLRTMPLWTFGKIYSLMFIKLGKKVPPVTPELRAHVTSYYLSTVCAAWREHYALPELDYPADIADDLIFLQFKREWAKTKDLSLEEWWAFDFIPHPSVVCDEDSQALVAMEQPPLVSGPLTQADAEWVPQVPPMP